MPFTGEDEAKTVEEIKHPEPVLDVDDSPAGETPPEGETPPKEEEPKTFTLTAEELERETNKATAAARRSERQRASRIEAENKELKAKLEAGQRPFPPNLKDFTDTDGEVDHTKFQNAMVAHEDKLHAWRGAQGVPTPAAVEPERAGAEFLGREAEMKEKHPDYEEVIQRPVFSEELADAIYTSKQGPDIAYHLGNNEAEALRIRSLPPVEMSREIGKLEARFSVGEPTRRTVSGAPAPITPVQGTATVEKDPEKMTTPEWMAHEKQKNIEKIKRKQELGG